MPTDSQRSRCRSSNKEFYVLSRLDPTGYKYHVVEVARLSGPLDLDALEASIATICERHEVLRSTFLERQGEPVQTVGTVRPRLERLDLATVRQEQAERRRFNRRHGNCCANLSILKRSHRYGRSCYGLTKTTMRW